MGCYKNSYMLSSANKYICQGCATYLPSTNVSDNFLMNYLPGQSFSIYSTSQKRNLYENIHENSEFLEEKYNDTSEMFLIKNAKSIIFLGDTVEIINEINTTLKIVTGNNLPYNLHIEICNEQDMAKRYGLYAKKIWNESIRGFCVPSEIKFIFVLRDSLDKMMLTIGHELGHVLTTTLSSKISEEAKAYAFEIMWLFAIKENNIMNLSSLIDLSKLGTPAANGVHDVAFRWVNSFLIEKKNIEEVYSDLLTGDLVICE